jgi:hypothetical protein
MPAIIMFVNKIEFVNHPCFQVGDRLRIYMEYVQLGSLNKFMHEHSGAMTESVVSQFYEAYSLWIGLLT